VVRLSASEASSRSLVFTTRLDEQTDKQSLKEDDSYGDSSDTMSGIYQQSYGSGMGGYWDSGTSTAGQVASSLSGILPIGIVPRVASTLMWGVENMTTRVIGLLKTLYAYFTKAFIPGLDAVADFKKVRQEEAAMLSKIDGKYAETLNANLAVLKDLDAWGITFLLDPSLGLGWRLLEKAPGAAMSIANALTGGHASEIVKNAIRHSGVTGGDLGMNGSFRGLFSQLGMTDLGLAEGTISLKEAQKKPDVAQLMKVIKGALNSKEMKEAIKNTGVSDKIKSFAANTILNRAKSILAKTTLEELAQVPELAQPTATALQAINQKAQEQKLSPQEVEQMKKGALGQLKETFKKLAIKNLQASVQSDPLIAGQVGVLIKQIQAMK
jgi:hypothetical protein